MSQYISKPHSSYNNVKGELYVSSYLTKVLIFCKNSWSKKPDTDKLYTAKLRPVPEDLRSYWS